MGYKNKINKGQYGLKVPEYVSYTPVESYTPDIDFGDTFSDYNFPDYINKAKTSEASETSNKSGNQQSDKITFNALWFPEQFNNKAIQEKYTNVSGLEQFNKYFNEAAKENPSINKYRELLTRISAKETNFRNVKNSAGAPAYGLFQFWEQPGKTQNITKIAKTDINTFMNNPKLQILAAAKLAEEKEKGFNKKDLDIAKQKGYNMNALIGGAWLGGNAGVKKYLYQGKDSTDSKHYGGKGGSSVAKYLKHFNH